jgi:CubicO group peptidase (beta-lactamase class C family)
LARFVPPHFNPFSIREVETNLFRFFLAVLFLSSVALAAPDEAILGKSEGYPVCKQPWVGGLDQRCYVGNLSHYDQVVTARTVKAGTPRPLKRATKEPALRYTHEGRAGTIDSFLTANRNTGLLVLKDDTILIERYQYERKPEHRFQSFSMAKTVVAMLIGIAIAEGKIGSIDDPAQQYVPQLKGHVYGETRLRHLLTMSSGVRFSEDYSGGDDIAILARRTLGGQGPGGVDTVLPFTERDRPAGTRFYYASAETQVLSLVLRAAVGRPLAEYLSDKIWQPMGAEADASWLIDGAGNELGYMGLNATLRDYARIGMLLANGGTLDGKQIVPAAWVKAMTAAEAPHLQRGVATRFNGYGYQTWLLGNTESAFALLGVRGQAVYVDPQRRSSSCTPRCTRILAICRRAPSRSHFSSAPCSR